MKIKYAPHPHLSHWPHPSPRARNSTDLLTELYKISPRLSTLDDNHVYKFSWQSIKNCERSLLLKLSNMDRPTGKPTIWWLLNTPFLTFVGGGWGYKLHGDNSFVLWYNNTQEISEKKKLQSSITKTYFPAHHFHIQGHVTLHCEPNCAENVTRFSPDAEHVSQVLLEFHQETAEVFRSINFVPRTHQPTNRMGAYVYLRQIFRMRR